MHDLPSGKPAGKGKRPTGEHAHIPEVRLRAEAVLEAQIAPVWSARRSTAIQARGAVCWHARGGRGCIIAHGQMPKVRELLGVEGVGRAEAGLPQLQQRCHP